VQYKLLTGDSAPKMTRYIPDHSARQQTSRTVEIIDTH